jgi:predicted ATPase
LALEVARELAGSYQDGVWLIELAPLSEPELVVQEVAGTLGVQEQPGLLPLESLIDTLGDKEMLLLIDNCEHLIGAVARLTSALLDSCPRIRLFATAGRVARPSGDRARQHQDRALVVARKGEESGTSDGWRPEPFLVHARLLERG